MTMTRSPQEDPIMQSLLDNEKMLNQTFYGSYSDAERVVLEFLQAWMEEDFEGAYDLLANNSPLREGSLRRAWTARRQAWADNAQPEETQAPFLYERDRKPEWIHWLASANLVGAIKNYKEVEAGWSIKYTETPQDRTLPELPGATVISDQTKSHWFWVCYQLVQEKGKWRIHSMIDEGIAIQDLPVEELRSCLQEVEMYRDAILRAGRGESNDDPLYKGIEFLTAEGRHNAVNQMGRCLWYSLSYIDALIKRFPHEYELYNKAFHLLLDYCPHERSLAYVEPLTQLQPTADNFQRLAGMHHFLSERYKREDDDWRAQRHKQWAEKAFCQEVLLSGAQVDLAAEAHIELAKQLLIGLDEKDKRKALFTDKDDLKGLFADKDDFEDLSVDEDDLQDLAEAKHHLLQAKTFPVSPEDEMVIEAGLGEIAKQQKDFENARAHFQRAVELNPGESFLWKELGRIFEHLKHFTDAEACFREAVKLDPTEDIYYYCLNNLYEENKQPEKALAVIREGARACPNSPKFHLSLAGHYLQEGDFSRAKRSLRQAERIDPEFEYTCKTRAMFDVIQSQLDTNEKLFKQYIAQMHLDPTDPLSEHLTNTHLHHSMKRRKRRRWKRNSK